MAEMAVTVVGAAFEGATAGTAVDRAFSVVRAVPAETAEEPSPSSVGVETEATEPTRWAWVPAAAAAAAATIHP
jgi:hypothetical protein